MLLLKIILLQDEIRQIGKNPVFKHRHTELRSEVASFDYSFIQTKKRVDLKAGLKKVEAQLAYEAEEDKLFPENSELFFNPIYALSEKKDGNRAFMQTNHSKANRFYGRRKKDQAFAGEFADNLPHLRDFLIGDLKDTLFDGEIVANVLVKKGNKVSDQQTSTSLILKPYNKAKAWGMQKANPCDYYIFDLLRYRGRDLKSWSWQDRHELLLEVFAKHRLTEQMPNILLVPFLPFNSSPEERMQFFLSIINKGGEGIVGTNREYAYMEKSKFSDNLRKLKKFSTADVMITGIRPGNGIFKGQAGGFFVSCIVNGALHQLGLVNIRGDSANRQEIMKNPKKYLGRIIEIRTFEWTLESSKITVASQNPNAKSKHIDEIFIFRDDKSEPDDLTAFFEAARAMRKAPAE